jgi:peptidoglycan/xylan/chitin deacetylase (PgdA/CDA1 family)
MIHRTPFILPLLYPSLVWRMNGGAKEIYLTFDDGPVPGPTEFVLHTLSRYNARATFFCIGDNVRKHPKVFQKVVDEGHAIGNHTFNHLNGWGTETPRYIENVHLCTETIKEATSFEPRATSQKDGSVPDAQCPRPNLFRPPYGRITRKQIKLLSAYKIIMWDVLSVDYNKHLSAEACLRNTVNACRAGSIVVFHDSLKAEKNMSYALPRLLDHFSERGYVFKSIAL